MGLVDKLKSALGLDGLAAEKSWEGRIQEGAYTTPESKLRITFDFQDLQSEFDKKTSAHNFPDASGTYIQDNGPTSWRYPMRIIFWGLDHDQKADVFQNALREKGKGKLEHPLYGTHDVHSFGTITRRDDLVTAANQTIFEVTFWETIGVVYPIASADLAGETLNALNAFNAAAAGQFATQLDQSLISEETGFLKRFNDLLDKAQSGLDKVAAVQGVINDQFQDITDSINRGIDVLVGQPLTLAFQTQVMIQAPARALQSITDRLDAYGNLAADIFGKSTDDDPNLPFPDKAISPPGGLGGFGPGDSAGGLGSLQSGGTAGSANDSQNPNLFHTRDLFASAYVTGSVLSALNHDFATRPEALETAEVILDQLALLNEWRDLNYDSISGQNLPDEEKDEFIQSPASTDLGDSFQALQNAVSLSVGYLIEQSFGLAQEMRVTLDRDRSVVDFVSEVYGEIDERLDFFIKTNGLTGSEILELPKGREVVYFV
jgi:hypothetical protein